MKKTLLLSTLCVLTAGLASAQISGTTVTTILADDPDVRAFTGATDSDPNGLAVLSDGRIVFFESEATAGNNAEDAVILFDPTQVGTARFNVIASEAALGALIGEPSPNIYAEDIAIDDNDNIYLLGVQTVSPSGNNPFVVKIPRTGSTYGIPELIAGSGVAPLGIPPTPGLAALEWDPANNRLILLIEENLVETALTGIAGLYTLPVTSGNPTPVQSLATRASMISVLTPTPSSDTNDRATFDDITVLDNGDILSVFNVRNGTQLNGESDGEVIKVSSTGSPSLFIDATTLSTDIADGFGRTTTWLHYNASRNAVALVEEFTTDAARNVIAEYSTSGAFLGVVADRTNLLQGSGATALRLFSRAFTSDSTGQYFVFTGLDNESCQQINVGTASMVEHWSFF